MSVMRVIEDWTYSVFDVDVPVAGEVSFPSHGWRRVVETTIDGEFYRVTEWDFSNIELSSSA